MQNSDVIVDQQTRDLQSFEILFEFESAVPAPLLVASLVKRLKPLTALINRWSWKDSIRRFDSNANGRFAGP